MGGESDEVLADRCKRGDSSAFRLLITRYERLLYNVAYRVLGNADDARDVTQVAFMEVAERIDEYDPAHKFFSWLYRIALNAALNMLRGNRRKDALGKAEPQPSAAPDPESRLADSELSGRIQRALMQLNEDHRVVMTLRHFSGCSYREIGAILGIEEKTVKSRLFEARLRMREGLRDLEHE
jgi:RNA polymerase sigma-70 factor (ECF subfamily)